MATTTSATSLPAYASAMPSGLRTVMGLIARPFAGIPLVLRDPIYRPLFLFFLAVGTGAGLWLNFVPVWLTQDLGVMPAQVGGFFTVCFLAAALGNVTMPMLAERVGSRKNVVLWLMLSGFPALLGLANANGYWMALASIAVLWFGAAWVSLMIGVAGDAARARAAAGARDQSGTVIAALQSAMALGMAVGPLLGGWLYEWTGQLRPVILVHLALALAWTWLFWRHAPDDKATSAAKREAVGRPGAIGLALLLFLVVEVWFRLGDARGPFETVYAAQELGASKAQVGVLLTTAATLQLVLTPVMGPLADRMGAGALTALGVGVLGVHGFLLAGTTAYWQQLTLLVLPAVGLAIANTAPFVYAQQLAPGRASLATGWFNACFFFGFAGGSALAGRVVELAGFRGLFVFSGAMDLSAAALVGALVLGQAIRRGSPGRRTPG